MARRSVARRATAGLGAQAALLLLLLSNSAFGYAPGPSLLASADDFRIHAAGGGEGLSEDQLEAVRQHLRDRRARVHLFLGIEDGLQPPVDVLVYSSVESKALATGDMSRAHALPEGDEIHLSLQPGLEGTPFAVEALVAAHRHLGTAAHAAFEQGLVARLSDAWFGGSPEQWTARLHRAGLVPPLEDLLSDEAFLTGSRLALPAVGATLLEWLRHEWGLEPGSERFRAFYRTWRPTPDMMPALEARWTVYLDRLAEAVHLGDGPSGPPSPPGQFRRGFNFAHEGYQVHNGYGSAQAERSLERLAAMGTDAVAILPYSSMRDPAAPDPIRISSRAGSENDEAVIHSALAARALGMSVLLKPHIWMRGGWPGEIRMSSEEDWERFFDEYARWIGHYAMLAEAYQLESLCLGVEMSAAAMEQPARWRHLARQVREIYSGELGYCANWGEEAETLTFWDAVDFIGVSSYYPLSSRNAPSDRRLLAEANRVMDRLEALGRRHHRPVLLTEAGFASSPRPWRRPWEEERGPDARVDLDAQARSYDILIQALEGREGIHGVYWWKWPTIQRRPPERDSGFTPAGKPAESVVAEWFGGF